MKFLIYSGKFFDRKLNKLLELRKNKIRNSSKSVLNIIKDVKKNGDKALYKYEKRFNKNSLIFPSKKEIAKSITLLDKKVKKAIDLAYNRIFNFHKNQKVKTFSITDKFKNRLFYRTKPIEKIGVYVPGGKASYPSSVLMNCIPAIVAGVPEIYMTVPCINKKVNPGVLYAAKIPR